MHRQTLEPLFRRELQLIGKLGDGAVFTETSLNPGVEEKVNPDITKIVSYYTPSTQILTCIYECSLLTILRLKKSKKQLQITTKIVENVASHFVYY